MPKDWSRVMQGTTAAMVGVGTAVANGYAENQFCRSVVNAVGEAT